MMHHSRDIAGPLDAGAATARATAKSSTHPDRLGGGAGTNESLRLKTGETSQVLPARWKRKRGPQELRTPDKRKPWIRPGLLPFSSRTGGPRHQEGPPLSNDFVVRCNLHPLGPQATQGSSEAERRIPTVSYFCWLSG